MDKTLSIYKQNYKFCIW